MWRGAKCGFWDSYESLLGTSPHVCGEVPTVESWIEYLLKIIDINKKSLIFITITCYYLILINIISQINISYESLLGTSPHVCGEVANVESGIHMNPDLAPHRMYVVRRHMWNLGSEID